MVMLRFPNFLTWNFTNELKEKDQEMVTILFIFIEYFLFVCLFDLILYVPVNNFSVMSDKSSWVEPVLSKDQ